MTKKTSAYIIVSFFISFSFMQFGCTGLYDAITNIQRLQFKLDRVSGMKLAGVPLSSIERPSNLSLLDAASLATNFAQGRLPAEFTLNVLAKNPNDGTGGTKNTSAVIKNLAWRLFIDNNETVKGNIGNITVPGVGQTTNIPIGMSLDLLSFFKNSGFDNLLNLALALGGRNGSSSRITLKATPTVTTVLGDITYPGEIDIIDREFTGGN